MLSGVPEQKHGGLGRERERKKFQAGLVLEAAVYDGLTQLGVVCRRTAHLDEEDVRDQLDLVVCAEAVNETKKPLAPTRRGLFISTLSSVRCILLYRYSPKSRRRC